VAQTLSVAAGDAAVAPVFRRLVARTILVFELKLKSSESAFETGVSGVARFAAPKSRAHSALLSRAPVFATSLPLVKNSVDGVLLGVAHRLRFALFHARMLTSSHSDTAGGVFLFFGRTLIIKVATWSSECLAVFPAQPAI